MLEVPPLDDAERRAVITAFLGRSRRASTRSTSPPCWPRRPRATSLYLRTVLDELRQHGDHFTIGDVIAHYLSAPLLADLLALVLERYERDFERDRPGLVRDSMRSLWAARARADRAGVARRTGGPRTRRCGRHSCWLRKSGW